MEQHGFTLRTADEGGYEVLDPRGNVIAWRGYATYAGEIADHMNRTYPSVAPAHDTLVHEVIDLRIAGVLT